MGASTTGFFSTHAIATWAIETPASFRDALDHVDDLLVGVEPERMPVEVDIRVGLGPVGVLVTPRPGDHTARERAPGNAAPP
jgi:hypothetical protein